jgi:hypothetical protein
MQGLTAEERLLLLASGQQEHHRQAEQDRAEAGLLYTSRFAE